MQDNELPKAVEAVAHKLYEVSDSGEGLCVDAVQAQLRVHALQPGVELVPILQDKDRGEAEDIRMINCYSRLYECPSPCISPEQSIEYRSPLELIAECIVNISIKEGVTRNGHTPSSSSGFLSNPLLWPPT